MVIIGYSACPLTRKAFEAQGHDVWTCDLLPARDGSANHIQGDIWDFLHLGWDFGVFHPMCTYLTTSGAWAALDPNFEKYPEHGYHQKPNPKKLYGAERRAARDADLENFRRLIELPFPKAIENPAVSAINTAIRPPDQCIHPYEFGDDASKNTGFWLTHGTPKLVRTQYVQPRLVCRNGHVNAYDGYSYCEVCGDTVLRPRWDNQTDSGQNALSPGENRWLERSKTYPGIAGAMGSQWGAWLNGLDAPCINE